MCLTPSPFSVSIDSGWVRAVGLEPTRDFSQRCLRPRRLPFRHARKRLPLPSRKCRTIAGSKKKTSGLLPGRLGAEDEIRTRDLLLGKEMLYR